MNSDIVSEYLVQILTEPDQIANICWIIDKAKEFQKSIYFCFIDYAKAFDFCGSQQTEKFWKRWEYQTTLPASWEIYNSTLYFLVFLNFDYTFLKVKAVSFCHCFS